LTGDQHTDHISSGQRVSRHSLPSLRKLIQEFNKKNLRDDNLEFPDLMGAAYEYLIKHFADSAGKKAGEFYTPNEIVKLLVNILEPGKDSEIYDPPKSYMQTPKSHSSHSKLNATNYLKTSISLARTKKLARKGETFVFLFFKRNLF
jgi:type I restriction-modification system DNA methylase subunit